MNTIEKKVEAAMRATKSYYSIYEMFIKSERPNLKRWAVQLRTLAVVKHDRLLNGR